MSDVSSVVKYFATANEGFLSTLGSTIAPGATAVPLNSVSGLTNGTVFVGIIEPGATNQQVFTGTVDTSGLQITGVKWTRGTNVAHALGVSIVDYVTGTALNMLTTGILKQHNQDGTHGAITATSLTTSGSVTATNGLTVTNGPLSIPNNIISASALATSAITIGYTQITSNAGTFATATSDTDLTGLTVTVSVPSGGRKVKITAYINYQQTGGIGSVSAILRIKESTTVLGTAPIIPSIANTDHPGFAMACITPTAGSHTYKLAIANVGTGPNFTITGSSTAPSFILVEVI